jgi:protocatechuate 3,4-dioxygenase beta subunit
MAMKYFEGRLLPDQSEPAYDQGLAFDIETLLHRRRLLKIMGLGAVGAGLAACGVNSSATPLASSPLSSLALADCEVIPEETAGPFPGDGSNGPDILSQSGVVRSDIRSSFGSSTTVATGIPLGIRFAIQDLENGCAPLADAAVYVWHCDQAGRYSMYTRGVTNENYLRGVQAAGSDGIVTFQSVFPACYQGRWPHIHFEVYPSLDKATSVSNKIATSQIALPARICEEVYATSGYESSIITFASVSLERDMVFAEDGGQTQLGTMTGSVTDGLSVGLAVAVRT